MLFFASLFSLWVLIFTVGTMIRLQRKILKNLRFLDYRIRLVLVALNSVESASVVEFYATIDGELRKVSQVFLKISQNLPLSIAIKDSKGNLAQVDGAPAWAVSDASLATLDVAADGMSALLKPVGPMGSFKVQVSADADLGAGVKSILGELDIDLAAGDASVVEISAGQPVDA